MTYTTYLPLVMNNFVVAEEDDKPMKPIVDISYWQQGIDYDKFADGISGAILRGAYGIWKDTMFETHYKELHARGVPLGSYHYIIGNYTGTAQADIFNQAIAGKDLKLGLWDDVEDRGVTTGLIPTVVNEYHSTIELLSKRKVGIYTGVYAWSEIMGSQSTRYGDKPLWVAHYGVTSPSLPRYSSWTSWVLWQWSSKGSIPGYPSSVDMDVFNGTEEEYQKYFSLSEIIPEPPPVIPSTQEVILPTLKVIKTVNIRSQPNTSASVLGVHVAGDMLDVLEVKPISAVSVWVRDERGWSAVVHYGVRYME